MPIETDSELYACYPDRRLHWVYLVILKAIPDTGNQSALSGLWSDNNMGFSTTRAVEDGRHLQSKRRLPRPALVMIFGSSVIL